MVPYYEQDENRAVIGFLGEFDDIMESYKRVAPAVLEAPRGLSQEGLVPVNPHHSAGSTCACGCGSSIVNGRTWVSGHNLNSIPRTDQHRANIGKAQKKAWLTKRSRLPLGSSSVSADGYVLIKVHEGAGPWKPEHIIVIEHVIGRTVLPGEVVHHINGIRADNRPENLFVFPSRSAHNDSHRSFGELLASLVEDGIVRFNRETGEYERA